MKQFFKNHKVIHGSFLLAVVAYSIIFLDWILDKAGRGPCDVAIIFLLPYVFLTGLFLIIGVGLLLRKLSSIALFFFVITFLITLVCGMSLGDSELNLVYNILYFAPTFIYSLVLIVIAYKMPTNKYPENTN